MTLRTCRIGLVGLALGTSCTEEPLVSTTGTVGESTSGSPTSFAPPPTISETTGDDPTSAPTSTGTSSSGDLTSTTAAGGPVCGDGVREGLEECDQGEANANTGECTLECKWADCGDGLVQQGVEQCDFGLGNDDSYDGCLPVTCQFGPRCGDGVLDVEHEICDRGELNGTGLTEDEFAPCSLACGFVGRLFFVTSQLFDGDLGGVSGADLKCHAAASKAGLAHSNKYRAWISDNFQSPATRFEQWDLAGVPLMLPGGRVISDDLLDLSDNGPHTGIARTELGDVAHTQFVWTNTSAFGEIFSIDDHCDGWLAAEQGIHARRGLNALAVEEGPEWDLWRAERWWTSYVSLACDQLARLYCVDDGFVLEQEE